MSETIFHEMNDVDPNERVQVGSYRVDGHGHQKLKDVIFFEVFFFVVPPSNLFSSRFQLLKQDIMLKMFLIMFVQNQLNTTVYQLNYEISTNMP
jgi:hypothetical protein